MKKRTFVFVMSAAVLILLGVVWYNAPIDIMNLDSGEVLEIVIFNGNTGNATHIDNPQQIERIVENLNSVKVKRDKPSLGYMGYSYKITIYLKDGNEAGDWNNFIINSESYIRKDPFFYAVTDGSTGYDYISEIVN